jgi:hypothetical protein
MSDRQPPRHPDHQRTSAARRRPGDPRARRAPRVRAASRSRSPSRGALLSPHVRRALPQTSGRDGQHGTTQGARVRDHRQESRRAEVARLAGRGGRQGGSSAGDQRAAQLRRRLPSSSVRARQWLGSRSGTRPTKNPGPRPGRERPPMCRPAKREQSTVCNRTTSPTGDLLPCKPPEQTYRRRPQVKEERGEALPTAAAWPVCRGPGRDAAEDRSQGPPPRRRRSC